MGECTAKTTFAWQLPIKQKNLANSEWIHYNAKYHYFVNNYSVCDNHWQDTKCSGTYIEAGKIMDNPEIACKKCFKKWLKGRQ